MTGGIVPTTAMILAGRLGTRLRPVVADRPKALAEIEGQPFLAHQLGRLAEAGIERAILCTGHRAAQIEAAFGSRYAGVSLIYSAEPSPLGTAGAIRLALPHLAEETTFVLNGDSLCDADLRAFAVWHHAHHSRASLLLTRVEDTSRYGRVSVAADGRVERFEEKVAATGAGWISAGIYLLTRDALATIPVDRQVSLEAEMFPRWMASDSAVGLHAMCAEASFIDIGTPESYAKAPNFLHDLREAA